MTARWTKRRTRDLSAVSLGAGAGTGAGAGAGAGAALGALALAALRIGPARQAACRAIQRDRRRAERAAVGFACLWAHSERRRFSRKRRGDETSARPVGIDDRQRPPLWTAVRRAKAAGATVTVKTKVNAYYRPAHHVRSDEAKPRMDLGLSAQCIRSAPDLLFMSASLRCRRRRSSRTSLRPFVGVPSRGR